MSEQVEVPDYDIAESVLLDPRRTALVIVDMQKDFVYADGALPIADAAATIPAIARMRALAHEHAIPVFYTQDSHYAGDPEFPIWGEHCLVGSRGWEIVDELAPEPARGDRIFRKDRYDGFHGTNLDQTLKMRGVDRLVICGTVANICVLYTAASAAIRWYHVILPVDAVSAITPFDLELTVRQVAFLFQGTITRADGLRIRTR